MSEQTPSSDRSREGVDLAALGVAAVSGAVIAAQGDARWGAFTTLLGLLLTALVLGFHRPVSGGSLLRRLFLRLAFGAAVALCLVVTLAWPMSWPWHADGTPGRFADATWNNIAIAALGLAALVACVEPDIAARLNGRDGR